MTPADAQSRDGGGEARQLARLRWRCRRGMRELDAVLQAFVEHAFAELSSVDRERMEMILDLPDPELHAYLVGRLEPEDPEYGALFRRIREEFRPLA